MSICSLANTGEPASLPRNSPICHCLVSIHSASRTSARSARSKLLVRGRPSSRFQIVTDGNSASFEGSADVGDLPDARHCATTSMLSRTPLAAARTVVIEIP